MKYPPVVIVNINDEVIGEAPLAEARERGLIYRIVFVIVEDDKGRVLLQRRSDQMALFPGCWDISAGGHVDDGHDYKEAAQLEVAEELGIEGLVLRRVAHFYTETPSLNGIYPKRYVTIYSASTRKLPDRLGKDEVSAVRWFTKAEIENLLGNHPELVAEGLLHAYHKVFAVQPPAAV